MTEASLHNYLTEILEDYIDDEDMIEDMLYDLKNFVTSNFDVEV